MNIRKIGYNTQDFERSVRINELVSAVNTLNNSSSIIATPTFVFVRTIDDLPDPVGGVIELLSNTTYFFVSDVDLVGNRLVCGVDTTILGTSSESASIRSTGLVGDALITSNYSLPIRNIAITADTAFDLQGDGATTALDWVAVNLINCNNIGLFKDFTNVIIKDSAFINSPNMYFDGNIATVGFDGCLFVLSSGVQMQVMSTLNITRRFRVIYSAFNMFGTAVGVDFDTVSILDEAFILDTVNFSGGGNYLDGIDHTSNKSLFINCVGIENSASRGFMFMVNNLTDTVIATSNAWTKVVGVTSAGATNSKYSHSSNRLTYAGAFVQSFSVHINASVSATQPNQVVSIAIARNGVVLADTEMTARANTSGQEYPVGTGYSLTLSPSDYIELFIKNNTSDADVRVSDFNMIINKIPA